VMTVLDIVSFADQGDSFFKHTDNLPNAKNGEIVIQTVYF